MAVTLAQAKQARDAFTELIQIAQAGVIYSNGVISLFNDGFTVKVGGEVVPLAQDIQDRLIDVAKYQAIKSNMSTVFTQKLP